MSGRFVPDPGLDAEIARRFGVPAVRRALDMLKDAAQANAPQVKIWVTMRDERVRPSHFEADQQAVPANLRFKISKADGPGWELARHPRDPDLSAANAANCRCSDHTVAHLLATSIYATDVSLIGNVASGSVETRFPRAAESEFGTDRDAAARFMGQALDEVAARLRAGHSR